MAIPKVIYQTFRTTNVPWITRLYRWWFLRKNKEYTYEFYDDERVDAFIRTEFSPRVYEAYKRLRIGAAKADFFRYAILYKKGGVYLDLDAKICVRLDDYIESDDKAILSLEKSTRIHYAQWAMVYEAGHPFLRRTLSTIVQNIERGRFPHNIHALTGPSVYSYAIRRQLELEPDTPHRLIGPDYEGIFDYKYFFLSKYLIYGNPRKHWRYLQERQSALAPGPQGMAISSTQEEGQ
ncbi:MAG: glycosyltransferase [Porphyromonas sp.]|nr:glycosyltransferase [Porphyromonas sp.]